MHAALAALIAVLAVIALSSLLTAALLGHRDHERDIGVLRAMGLTPLEVRGALMMRTTVLALVAVVGGAAVGRLVSTSLISSVSRLYGLGSGIGRPPSVPTLAATIGLAIGAAAIVGVLPARPLGRLPRVAVLGP